PGRRPFLDAEIREAARFVRSLRAHLRPGDANGHRHGNAHDRAVQRGNGLGSVELLSRKGFTLLGALGQRAHRTGKATHLYDGTSCDHRWYVGGTSALGWLRHKRGSFRW